MSLTALAVDPARVEQAAGLIDAAVRDTPQFSCRTLDRYLGLEAVLKVELVNPLRSFKGRPTETLVRRAELGRPLVVASAGNLGQGLAWAGQRHGVPVCVFSARSVPELKLARMRGFGAEVILVDGEFDDAKRAAEEHTAQTGARLVVDGIDVELAEGAGTIGRELTEAGLGLDAVVVPVGNGSLAAGVAAWMREASPGTRVIAVGAAGAPAMHDAWASGEMRAGPPIATCAEGLAARIPVPGAVAALRETLSDFVLVADDEMLAAMRLLYEHTGLVAEASGAAPLAAASRLREELAGGRVALVIGGGNASPETLRQSLLPSLQDDAAELG